LKSYSLRAREQRCSVHAEIRDRLFAPVAPWRYGLRVVSPVTRHRYTYQDYLAVEETSEAKHEYFAGDIYAMAGGTPEHAALQVAVTVALENQLRDGPCRVYSSDLRVRVLATGVATYPDVTVVYGSLERDPEDKNNATNPTVIVEVLSDSTEDYDRGEKLKNYQLIPSLNECVLVSHRARRIEIVRRGPSGWISETAAAGQQGRLSSIGCSLDVDALHGRALGPA
jgi:Uma2 family endonuclease